MWHAGMDRAAILAHEAGTRVDAIEKASAGGDWDAAKKTVATAQRGFMRHLPSHQPRCESDASCARAAGPA